MAGATVSYGRVGLRESGQRCPKGRRRRWMNGVLPSKGRRWRLEDVRHHLIWVAGWHRRCTWFLNHVCFYPCARWNHEWFYPCCKEAQEEMCLCIMFGSFQIIRRRYTISFINSVVFCIIIYIVYFAVSLLVSALIREAQLFMQDAMRQCNR
jgi:hypothetical protein